MNIDDAAAMGARPVLIAFTCFCALAVKGISVMVGRKPGESFVDRLSVAGDRLLVVAIAETDMAQSYPLAQRFASFALSNDT